MSKEELEIKEYEVANENLRYIGNICVAEVTIFIAVTGALLTVLFNLDTVKHHHAICYLKLLGVLTSVSFLITMFSTRHILFHFTRRADTLEKTLHFKLWSTLAGGSDYHPKIKILRSMFGNGAFHIRPHLYAHLIIGFPVLIIWICALYAGDAF
jgi:hypothetical protein